MKLKEQQTHKTYAVDTLLWRGENGFLFDLETEAVFSREKIDTRKPNMWRYREAIPIIGEENVISFEEGFTPLLPVDFNGKRVWIKQEQLFSTGSYKDRGASVLMSHVKSLKVKHVVQDSSGNAGCAVAAYAAKAGINCDIYVPADTSPAKLAQIAWYGANIQLVPGSREDTAAKALEAAQHIYYASHCYNPFFLHGTKTFAYEVCEQLHWKAPDAVVLPAGNGTLLLGCEIGFYDLYKAGIISKLPKLIAVQSAHCAPLYHAFHQGLEHIKPVETLPTLAEGIAIAQPVRAQQMLQAVKQTHGTFISVSEEEITNALIDCLNRGYYIEPTSAATIAGLLKYVKESDDNLIVSLFSGHGLKSTEKLMKILDKKNHH